MDQQQRAKEQAKFYDDAVKQFLSTCNISTIARCIGSDFDTVMTLAVKWVVPSIAEASQYHVQLINARFVDNLRQREYNPLQNAVERGRVLNPGLNSEGMTPKEPYRYSDKQPNGFSQQTALAKIIKNNLPGNQKTRYLRKEGSIYEEEHELANFIRTDKTKIDFYGQGNLCKMSGSIVQMRLD